MSLTRRNLILSGTAALSLPTMSLTSASAADRPAPLITGHRGAPGYLPEHTIPGYELAIKMGADFIEPDVVSTSDGHLVVRHDATLSGTTDVEAHPEFASRKRMRTLDGIDTSDFFVCDFTLAELKTLRARQAFADRDHSHDGLYDIVTLQQVIDVAQAKTKETRRVIGVYPELKHPSFHAALGLSCEDKLLEILSRAGLTQASSPVIIQSFEQGNLQYLRRKTPVRLMQLIDGTDTDPVTGAMILKAPNDKPYDWVLKGRGQSNFDLLTPKGLKEIADYADIVAPWKRWLISFAGGKSVKHKDIVDNAHAVGLKVHSWTMRDDRLDAAYKGDAVAEYLDLFAMGVDGLFSDFPDTAVRARDAFMGR